LQYVKISAFDGLDCGVDAVLSMDGPVICEVCVAGDCLVTPRTATQALPDGAMRSSPLENQFPFLSDSEVRENML
jgi:acetolactate synthase-1/2/3 large subunit